jgi:hypothetical protein
LPDYAKKEGPEIFRRQETASFLSNRKRKRPIAIWVDGEMRITMLIARRAKDARKFVRSLLLTHRENSGISKDLIVNKIHIYSGSDRKIIKGPAKEAVSDVVSTEHLVFR